MMVTLRGDKMYAFLDKLISVVLSRVRDFKGISQQSFDEEGNLNMGLREQIIFPEINYDKVEKIHGLDISFVMKNNKNRELVKDFLSMIGMPLRK